MTPSRKSSPSRDMVFEEQSPNTFGIINRGRQSNISQANAEWRDINLMRDKSTTGSLDIGEHLHPLKESTWLEIFPFLAYLDYTKCRGFGQPLRKNKKEYMDFDDEKIPSHLKAVIAERSFMEQLQEFDDP